MRKIEKLLEVNVILKIFFCFFGIKKNPLLKNPLLKNPLLKKPLLKGKEKRAIFRISCKNFKIVNERLTYNGKKRMIFDSDGKLLLPR